MFTTTNLPAVVAGQPGKDDRAAGAARYRRAAHPDPTVLAQLLGQRGQTRGLKGGPSVLNAAQSAYLGVEWRGVHDRRLPPGALRRVTL